MDHTQDHYRIAVTESITPNKEIREKSVVICTETKNADSESMVAALHINAHGTVNGVNMYMNRLATAYGSSSVDYKSYKALKDYVDTGKVV